MARDIDKERDTASPDTRTRTEDGQTGRVSRFFVRGKSDIRSMVREAANYGALRRTPYGLRPVIIFTLIGIVAAFDARIFGDGLPEIVLDTGVNIFDLFGVVNLASLPLVGAILIGAYYADRVRRVPYVGIGAMINGVFSIATSRTSTYLPMGLSRIGDSVGGNLTQIPVGSLFGDYYPPDARGKVFALFGVSGRVIALIAPVTVAVLVTTINWRAPFVVTGALMIVVGIVALVTLKEPIRGYMERRAIGLSEEESREPIDPPSFAEAWRTIWSIRTLRRLFISDIPGSAGAFIVTFFYAAFILEFYGLDILDRALILAVPATLVALPFGFLAGGMVDVLIRRRPERVLVFVGVLGVISSFALLLFAAAPPLWVIVATFVLFSAVGALIGPASGVLYLQILPPHVRTLGGAIPVLATIPGTILRGLIVPYIGARYGVQGSLFLAFPFIFISALIQLSAAGLFSRDLRTVLAQEAATVEFRKAREEGQAKMLVCRDVDVEYDGVQVLFGVDFDLEEGEILALLGTNGAGKSTLLKAISGVAEASAGAIVYDGREITHMPPHEVAPRGIILMPGGKGIFPNLTVRENLMLGGWVGDDEGAKSRLEEVLRIFPILKDRGGDRAGVLSGGEQQMLSLAQAFLTRPRLLMIDELSLGLAPAVVQQLIEIVKAIHAQGTTVILVEQSVNVALTVAERAVFMEKGEVRFVGKTEELLTRSDILRAVYVKGTGSLTGASPRGAQKSERELRQYELEQARAILEVKNLSRFFGGIKAVDDVTFDLREGEILGLIGPNGAGKTTVLDLITGYQIPDSGTITFDGKDVTHLPPEERAKLRLVRRFQDARLFPSLSVYENLLVALDQRMSVRNIALTALQLPQVRQAEKRIRARADRLIELLDLEAFRDKFVKELSTGLRRITDLACVLAAEPKVLLLDEPSSGIAQAEAEMLGPLLRRVRFETGCSILVIEHDMPLVSSISDELIAMDQGRVVVRGHPEDVLNDDRVIESYLGTSEDAIRRTGSRRSES